ncbi:MAG: STAS-like domain-containing protein [Kribbellaceae bacterium]|nr:STAS-like domain-containing protein [Kribbellaceae bacterium]
MSEPAIFSVVQLGEYPATRSRGQEGRVRLDDLLVDREGVDLTIDFAGVKVMNISFADEFLGKFLVSHDFAATGTTVKVAGLNADNRYSVVVCVERREARVVVREEDGKLTLVGDKIDKMLSATFEKAIELGTFKANDLADALSLTAQNANNRLKRLTESGALRRAQVTGSTRGGKQFVYHAVSAEIPAMSA